MPQRRRGEAPRQPLQARPVLWVVQSVKLQKRASKAWEVNPWAAAWPSEWTPKQPASAKQKQRPVCPLPPCLAHSLQLRILHPRPPHKAMKAPKVRGQALQRRPAMQHQPKQPGQHLQHLLALQARPRRNLQHL